MTAIGGRPTAIRYLVEDVDVSIAFYARFGFVEDQRMGTAFAIVSANGLRLWLSGPASSAARTLSNGAKPTPGGWNRLVVEVDDLDTAVRDAAVGGATLRGDPILGPGGRQVVIDDPSGNPIELFEARR